MLTLNHSLLNKEYNLTNVPRALASIVSICSLHVILLSKITPRYLTLFTNGLFRPFNVRRKMFSFCEKSRLSESYPY
jgi:hypothetical protein